MLPLASLSTTETVPEGCGVDDVTVYVPLAATGTLAMLPSGNVTLIVEPGSPVPETVNVPFGFAVVVALGATGTAVSVKGVAVAGDVCPAGSVAVTDVEPDGCGVADVAEYVPLAATGTVAVVPSGNVTLIVEPGSAVPDTFSVPFGFAVTDAVGGRGAVVSV